MRIKNQKGKRGCKMRTTLKIEGIEQKTSKQGREYKSIRTTQGNMSCFENNVLIDLVKNVGNFVSVDVEERNGFKNITGFGQQELGATPAAGTPSQATSAPQSQTFSSKDQTFYTSYAKDVFIALLSKDKTEVYNAETLMQNAIDLVKKAREAFN